MQGSALCSTFSLFTLKRVLDQSQRRKARTEAASEEALLQTGKDDDHDQKGGREGTTDCSGTIPSSCRLGSFATLSCCFFTTKAAVEAASISYSSGSLVVAVTALAAIVIVVVAPAAVVIHNSSFETDILYVAEAVVEASIDSLYCKEFSFEKRYRHLKLFDVDYQRSKLKVKCE